MSYFDDASLVMIPSGYKTSKVYSVKPTDGTGDLTFTRSNDTATRVASSGLIEKVRTNLILQSQAFNTTWSTGSVSVTANTTANPLNGAVNADTITLTGATTQKYLAQSNVFNGSSTISVYLKAGTHQFVQLMLGTDATPFANFDLINGTASATSSTATIVSAGSGFFRCSMSFASTTGTDVFITAADSLATTRFQSTASTGTFIAFGCQVETGDIATAYIATTTAAVSVGPVANVPRLDYLNSTCPRLLLEPQRTNLFTYSEQLDNAAWLSAGGTTTANTAVSPSGYQDADTLTGARFQTSFGSNTYTLSAFAKKVDGDGTFTLRLDVPANTSAVFNLNNGTIVSTYAGYTSSITAYGNGWYRCTFTSPASTTISNAVLVSANAGVSNTYVYGCQLEVGAYATSYIPTLGASVTRGADAASKTGISSLIGQTEGTMFADFTLPTMANTGVNLVSISLFNAGLTNATAFDIYDGGDLFAAHVNGTTQASIQKTGLTAGRHTSGTVGAQDSFGLQYGTSQFIGQQYISQALLFTTRLTNAQLAELTTI
jgi:hypothetical protein